jgi:hypothetical protein
MNGDGGSWRFALHKKRVGDDSSIMAVNCRKSLLPADVRWTLAPEWDIAAREPHSQLSLGANLSIWSRFRIRCRIPANRLLTSWLLKIAEFYASGCFVDGGAALRVARINESVNRSTMWMQASHRFIPFGDI